MTYCPSLAISKHETSGAVLINPDKCIGCRYCAWVCPYDAPQFNLSSGIMEKCTLCQHRLEEGLPPACVSLCPTSALKLAEGMENYPAQAVAGFTRTDIKPAIKLIPLRSEKPLMQTVALPFDDRTLRQFEERTAAWQRQRKISWLSEWPLILFTVLTALLTGLASARLVTGLLLSDPLFVLLAGGGFAVSTLHLGRKIRAVRAVLNWRHSWISREIITFTLFFLLTSMYLYLWPDQTWLAWAALFAGYTTLITMDNIYRVLPRQKPQLYHSAGAFLSGLYFAAVLSEILPLAFLFGMIKSVLYLRDWISDRQFTPLTCLIALVRMAGLCYL